MSQVCFEIVFENNMVHYQCIQLRNPIRMIRSNFPFFILIIYFHVSLKQKLSFYVF